jgi:hypothetical protein
MSCLWRGRPNRHACGRVGQDVSFAELRMSSETRNLGCDAIGRSVVDSVTMDDRRAREEPLTMDNNWLLLLILFG